MFKKAPSRSSESPDRTPQTPRAAYDAFVAQYPPKSKYETQYNDAFARALTEGRIELALLFLKTQNKSWTAEGERLIATDTYLKGLRILIHAGQGENLERYLNSSTHNLGWYIIHDFPSLWPDMRKSPPGISVAFTKFIAKREPDRDCFIEALLNDDRADLFSVLIDENVSSSTLRKALGVIQEKGITAEKSATLINAEMARRTRLASGQGSTPPEGWDILGNDSAVLTSASDAQITVTRIFNFRARTVLSKISAGDGICCTESPFANYDESELNRAYSALCARTQNPVPFGAQKNKTVLEIPPNRRKQ